jgi:DNA invertase Pin-like site-specific DNA recombinase
MGGLDTMTEKDTEIKFVNIGYVRTSRKEQDAAPQFKMILDAGIVQDNIFSDVGVSGMALPDQRSGYSNMLKAIQYYNIDKKDDHIQIGKLYISEFSRLGRDSETTFKEWFRLLDMGLVVVPLSPIDASIASVPKQFRTVIMAMVNMIADMERTHLKERTRYGMENARMKGKQIGRPKVVIDFDKIQKIMDKYGVTQTNAVKFAGYKPTVFYRELRKKRELENIVN